jgi:DNA repair exonuclease SbcCD ATPase subunit
MFDRDDVLDIHVDASLSYVKESDYEALRQQVAELEATRNECERQYQDAMDKYIAELDRAETAESQLSAYREALEKISRAEGRYSACPLEHASNTVEDMALIAIQALAGDAK